MQNTETPSAMLDPDPNAARCVASRRNDSGAAAETTPRRRRPMYGQLESVRREFKRFVESEAHGLRVLVLLIAMCELPMGAFLRVRELLVGGKYQLVFVITSALAYGFGSDELESGG